MRVLSQVPQANQVHTHRLLECLMVSVRPLRVEELAELLSFDFDTAQGAVPEYRLDWRPHDQAHAVLSTCSTLITMVDDNGSKVVQFSHFSVKEFLTSDRFTSSSLGVSQYQINPGPAHTILAQACLGSLLHLGHLGDHVNETIVKSFPLAKYAAQHWVTHVQFEDVASRVKDGMESLFDYDKPYFAVWVWIHNIDHRPYRTRREFPPTTPTPLYYTALCGFHDLVERLAIQHPEHVNAVGGWYEFPLLAALGRKHIRAAEILLEHGANVNSLDDEGKTPLYSLFDDTGRDDDDILIIPRLLLKHGADVNTQMANKWTPLHAAAFRGMPEVVQILLDHGANTSMENDQGETALHLMSRGEYRSKEDNFNVARLLLEHGMDVNARKKNKATPLHLAVSWGRFEIVRVLLDNGANPNAENEQHETPLHLVSRGEYDSKGHGVGISWSLLERGAGVNARKKYDTTPLHSASFRWTSEITRALIDHDAIVNAKHDQGETPLHLVSRGEYVFHQECDVRIARLLLERGADVNAQSKNKSTPLHSAVFKGRTKIAKLLLECGAVADAMNDQGETPLHLVSRSEYDFQERAVDIAQLLLERGVDVNTADKGQNTPLHSASYLGRFEAARVLLGYGARASSENDQAQTPLHLVSQGSYWLQDDGLGVARLLLDYGADVNARDKDHATPLHLACYRGRLEIARVLLGYDVQAQEKSH
ncbi:ankyrin repeat-containing domain protein [Lactarius vividus]|nr:ankyrin repeat-containing domain protein [Lactarius vividus]